MKAIVIEAPGGPEVLTLREVPSPSMRYDHVRVAVRFAGCNRADLMQRAGVYPAPPGVPSDVPGLEYAGEVVEIGEGVQTLKRGDRVYGIVGGGAYAEELIVHSRQAVKIADGISYADAAAIPEAFLTAYDGLTVRGRVRPGDRVLIHAAGSGVGTAAVQLAKAIGCTTIGTSRTSDKLARCKELGLDVAIVPENGAFADQVLAATEGQGVDVVIDLVGGPYFSESMRACASRARIVCIGMTGGNTTEMNLALLFRKRLEIIATTLRARPVEEKIDAAALLARPITPWLAERRVKAIVERIVPLADASEAHRLLATDATFGKVLLEVS